ncbi:hypothetical protein FSP39_018072 [Pinctada imbricata]|uniref:Reverse transcriptase domain-containing protein n=1 Tax=Pinctada imbricata TaxID=66713 RepID=A0AA88Y562_PINIB|nr:hypothetical protein FSP39_018072 [Pinctada imbricata]
MYTTLPHDKINDQLSKLIKWCYNREGKTYICTSESKGFFSATEYKSYKSWTCSDLCSALSFLLDNICVRFGENLYKQVVGIPMGTNCAPLVADLFLYTYEKEFIQNLQKQRKLDDVKCFIGTSRYLDDILTIDNPAFEKYKDVIYPQELTLNKANFTDNETPFLDLNIKIVNGEIHTSVYDKRDDFGFSIVNFPWLDGDVPRLPSYGIYISQLIRDTMGESVLYDVLSVIRQKQREADMDIKPSKRIFGTDMEHPDTTEEYLNDMARRVKIKEKLRAARERRKERLEELDKGIDRQLDGENPAAGNINLPLTGKLSMGDVVKEYIARRGKSVKLKEHSNHVSSGPAEIKDSNHESNAQPNSLNEKVSNDVKNRLSSPKSIIDNKENSNELVVTVDIEYSNGNVEQNDGKTPDKDHHGRKDQSDVNDVQNGHENSHTEPHNTVDESKIENVEPEEQNCHPVLHDTSQTSGENKDINCANDSVPHNSERKLKSSKIRKKWKKAKLLPITLAATKLKQKMEEENKRQMEFLETLRLLRGISRDEFYKDVQDSSSEEEDDGSDEEEEEKDGALGVEEELHDKDANSEEGDPETDEPTPSVNDEETEEEDENQGNETGSVNTYNDSDSKEQIEKKEDPVQHENEKSFGVKEVKFRKKQPKKKKVTPGCRIDTRWPVGHRLHTRPEMLYLSCHNSKLRNGQYPRPKIANHSKRSIMEYEHWREQLLQIAYLKEFDHVKGKSLREFSLPLPDIYTQKRYFHEKESHLLGIKSLDSLSSHKSDQSCFSESPLSSRKGRRKRFRRRSQTVSYLTRDTNKTTTDTKASIHNASHEHAAEHFQKENVQVTEPLYELVRTAVEDVREQDDNSDEDNYSDREHEGEDAMATTYSLRSLQSVKSQSSDSAINEPSNHSDLEDDSLGRLSEPQSIPVLNSQQTNKISVEDYRSLVKPNNKSREDRVMENLYQLRANRYKCDPDHPESTQKNRNRKTIDRSKMRKRTELLPLFSSNQRKSTKMSPRVWNND